MVCDVVLMGDINFDMARLGDPNYQNRDIVVEDSIYFHACKV